MKIERVSDRDAFVVTGDDETRREISGRELDLIKKAAVADCEAIFVAQHPELVTKYGDKESLILAYYRVQAIFLSEHNRAPSRDEIAANLAAQNPSATRLQMAQDIFTVFGHTAESVSWWHPIRKLRARRSDARLRAEVIALLSVPNP